ncbi:MAG: hypothetical protein IPO65_14490 [Saprospiraceae bacterium]|nr:hypothetical protein [Saprospiraceae bacterium]MBK9688891.1 hypothetical protein [Saprospiraceae bacterium]
MKNLSYLLLPLIFIIGLSTNCEAKKKKLTVEIKMLTGEIKKGLLELPISNSHTRIVYRMDEEASKEAIRSNDIDYLLLFTEEDTFYIKRTQYYNPKKKLGKGKDWLLRQMNCKNFQTYILVQGFETNSDGDFFALYLDGMGMYLMQRNDEKYPTELGYIFIKKIITQGMFDKQRKEFLMPYFEKDKEAMSFINGKEKIKQDELIEFLTSICEQ